jgi:hypothetical protein
VVTITQGDSNSIRRIIIKNLTQIPRFLPNPDPLQTKKRLTILSSGLFLPNAPKEICSELFYDGDLQRLSMSIPILTRYDDKVTIVPTLGLGKIGIN